jgi:hypothetical protein
LQERAADSTGGEVLAELLGPLDEAAVEAEIVDVTPDITPERDAAAVPSDGLVCNEAEAPERPDLSIIEASRPRAYSSMTLPASSMLTGRNACTDQVDRIRS